MGIPYRVKVVITGCADLLFHGWNCQSVAEKASAAKGSKEKKTDDLESYVRRNDKGGICILGEYLQEINVAFGGMEIAAFGLPAIIMSAAGGANLRLVAWPRCGSVQPRPARRWGDREIHFPTAGRKVLPANA